MCGFVGIWSESDVANQRLMDMSAKLTRRGPDAYGSWRDGGILLGHRRLSIQDLSEAGAQPMQSERYAIAFNGEVYNLEELRRNLPPRNYRGHSDTEVMLWAIETWGLRKAVDRFVGMFAFALWDKRERHLSLVRDRFGIKPLVYGYASDGALLFGSELRALRAGGLPFELRSDVIDGFFRLGYVSGTDSVYQAAFKVQPGSILRFAAASDTPTAERYWSARALAEDGLQHPFVGTDHDAIEELDAAVADAVKLRLVSDVPVGAFLSGGIDSTLVTATMVRQAGSRVRTFSIGSPAKSHDESGAAAAIARYLGTEHTELIVSERDALDFIPHVAGLYDEPFADSSQLPTYFVSKLAREKVVVSLSGDGGDELFGGYNRHVHAPRLRNLTRRVPASVWDSPLWGRGAKMLDRLSEVAGDRIGVRTAGDKLRKVVFAAEAKSESDFYERAQSIWWQGDVAQLSMCGDFRASMMLWDQERYLVDDILTKVDRASMAVSLEARVPLLDHRIAALAWKLAARGGDKPQGKWFLREVLARHVPRVMWERPKTGFGIPVANWLRGPLKTWALDQLEQKEVPLPSWVGEQLPRIIAEHMNGTHDHAAKLWVVLMYLGWYQTRGESNID